MAESVTSMFMRRLEELPSYCMDFFTAKFDSYMPKTKLAYTMDLYTFFYYLVSGCKDRFPYSDVRNFPIRDLEKITSDDISRYLVWLSEYTMPKDDGTIATYTNSPAGKKRKLCTLKSFFRYLNVSGKIKNDPTVYIDTPKIRKKEIIVLSDKEEAKLMSSVDSGKGKTKRGLKFHKHTKHRDIAILMVFLGTGIRVSELVHLQLYDLDFDEQRFLVTRKGGKQEFVYFNNEVLSSLADYLDIERRELIKRKGDPDENGPLFLSNRGTGITVTRVEQIIKEAAAAVMPPNMKVSCHTLRKTYGTNLYEKYGDLLLAQHALGHESSETTSRSYTKFNPDRLKKLREF